MISREGAPTPNQAAVAEAIRIMKPYAVPISVDAMGIVLSLVSEEFCKPERESELTSDERDRIGILHKMVSKEVGEGPGKGDAPYTLHLTELSIELLNTVLIDLHQGIYSDTILEINQGYIDAGGIPDDRYIIFSQQL